MERLYVVILAASVFEISCGKTDRQTDRQTDAAENPIPPRLPTSWATTDDGTRPTVMIAQ